MHSPSPAPVPAPLPIHGEPSPVPTKRRALAATFLESILPGGGYYLIGESWNGFAVLAVVILFLGSLWAFRISSDHDTLILWVCLVALFCLVSSISAVRRVRKKGAPISFWWLVLLIPISIVAGDCYLGLTILASGFRPYYLLAESMEPTIMKDERIIVDLHSYKYRVPARKDLIVFRKNGVTLIKRLIGVGGDTVQGRDGIIFVNGEKLDEPYVKHTADPQMISSLPEIMNFGPVHVPAGKLFVLGDNRENSYDSRIPGYGWVDAHEVMGKALYILYTRQSGRLGKILD